MTLPPLWRRMLNALSPGTVSAVDDSGPVQKHQINIAGRELHDGVPAVYIYGVSSNPPLGADALLVFLGGDRGSGVVVATNHQQVRHRGLVSGEVILHDNQGQSIYLSRSGITIQGAGLPVTIDAPLVHLTGSLHVDGDVTDHATTETNTLANFRSIYDAHTHTDSRGGTTAPPVAQIP